MGERFANEEAGAGELSQAQSRQLDAVKTGSDAQEGEGDHGGDDLEADGVFVAAEEGLDLEMLLDPAEEELDLPAGLVEGGDFDGGALHVVGDEG